MKMHEKIAQYRHAAGLTQEKLGALLGVSPQAVSKWEKAECLPDVTLLPALCAALGLSADALLDVPPVPCRKGEAKIGPDGIRIVMPDGIGLNVSGAAVQSLLNADVSALQALLSDETGLRILRTLGFTARREEDVALRCGLSIAETQRALLRLLRGEYCLCTPDGWALGANAYVVFAALAAARVASPEGRAAVANITTTYTT